MTRLPYLAICAMLLSAVTLARGQDPFADPPAGAPAAVAEAPAADDPFGAAGKPAAAKPGEERSLAEKEPLVIQQLRDSNPTAPEAILKAAHAVLQFGRPDECKRYLTKFMAAKFSDDQLAATPNKVGSGLLIHLARHADVQPEGQQVADLVLNTATRQVRDPAAIAKTIDLLSSPEPGVRKTALAKLGQSGEYVVTPMLRVLADAGRESEHRYLRAALVHLAASTEEPLLGAIDVPNEYLKAQVIAVLGRIESRRAVMHLVRLAVDDAAAPQVREVAAASLLKMIGSVPDRYEARKYLEQEIKSLLGGRLPYEPDPDGLIQMWSWDEAAREVTSRKLPKADAALLLASRLAADLAALAPEASAARRMQLLTSLELAKVLGGLDRPLMPPDLHGASPQTISQVLSEAIELGRVPAIVAAAELLGDMGDASVLTSAGPQESPLALALLHPDRRVRLTAALAIVELNPKESFPGSSRVLTTLAQAIETSGTSRVLIGNPRGEEAQTLVGFMNDVGLEGDTSYGGRRLVELAQAGTDYELILISDAIDGPPVKDLVQWLRKDYRTARIPVGVMARGDDLHALRYAFEDDPLTTVVPRIHTSEVARADIAQIVGLAGRNFVGRDERIAQASAALAALGQLARSREGFDLWNVLRHEDAVIAALNGPLPGGAAAVLGQLATPKSQTALVDFASQTARALADRQAAGSAFAAAVSARGVNLTQQQIALQFERYNASETLDPETQAVLASLLDVLEAPTSERGE